MGVIDFLLDQKNSSFNNNNESIYKEQSLSVVAILSAYMHTNRCIQRCPHTSILTIQSLIYAQIKWAANRDFWDRWRQQHGTENMAIVLKMKCFEVWLKWIQREFLSKPSERKGKGISCGGTKGRKGAGTNSGKSGARILEAESVRSRAESTGGCVKLKTVTEIRWSSAHNTFITESVYLVLNSLLDWEPVERFK